MLKTPERRLPTPSTTCAVLHQVVWAIKLKLLLLASLEFDLGILSAFSQLFDGSLCRRLRKQCEPAMEEAGKSATYSKCLRVDAPLDQ